MNAHEHKRIYVGRLDGGRQAAYAVDGVGVEPIGAPGSGSIGWGPGAGDAADRLAAAILADASGGTPPLGAPRAFRAQVLSRMPADGFALPRCSVETWLRLAPTR